MPKPLRSVVAVRVAHHASVRRDVGRAHHAIYLRADGPIAVMIPERPIAGMIPERPIAVMMPEHSREQRQAPR